MAQWVRSEGPYGGIINSISSIGGNVVAGINGGGVYVSTDNGSTWAPTNLTATNINAYSFVPSGSRIFTGTSNGVFLSSDDGLTWASANSGLTNLYVQTLAVNGTLLFAGTNGGGVFVSTDDGAAWSAANSGISTSNVQALAVVGTDLFAGTNSGGVYLSADSGKTWTAITSYSGSSDVQSFAVAGTDLYVGTNNGVYLTTDQGTSWSAINSGLGNLHIHSLLADGSDLYAGTDYAVYMTTDNGTSWSAANTGLTNTYNGSTSYLNIYALGISGTDIFAGAYGQGIFISTDNGSSWNATNSGLTANNVFALCDAGGDVLAGASNGVFLSTDNGTTWSNVVPDVYTRAVAANGSVLAAGSPGNGVSISKDGGTTWTISTSGMSGNSIYGLAWLGNDLFAAVYGTGVFVSTDSGSTWNSVSNGLSNTNVYPLAVNGQNIYAGTWGGGVFMSTDRGADWSAVNNGMSNMDIRTLLDCGKYVFAGTDAGGIYVTSDAGADWTAVDNGLTTDSVYALARSGTILFAATDRGIFSSTNYGSSWSSVNTGLTNPWVHSLTVAGTNLVAGTFGASVWKRPMSDFMFTTTDSIFTIENFDISGDLGLFANVPPGGNAFHGTNVVDSIQQVNDPTGLSAGAMAVYLNFSKGVSGYGQIDYGYVDSTSGYALLSAAGAKYLTFWVYLPSGESVPNLTIQMFAMDNVNYQWEQSSFSFSGVPRNVWVPLSLNLDSLEQADTLFDISHGLIAQTGFQIGNWSDSTAIWSGNIYVDNLQFRNSLPPGDIPLDVQATGFKAATSDGTVDLTWQTQSEVDNLGFNILRKDAGTGESMVIASYTTDASLRGLGTSTVGRSYSYVDNHVSAGQTYDYTVQSVSTNGTENDYPSIEVKVDLPKNYALYQNYPNPFNPTTTIAFDLKEASDVTLSVYNVLGQRVAELNYGAMNAGSYDKQITMDRFASGVYYYRIDAAGSGGKRFVSVKKMMLVK